MNKKKMMILFSATTALTLAACGGNNSSSSSTSTEAGTAKTKYASEVTHEGTPIKGGTLNMLSYLHHRFLEFLQMSYLKSLLIQLSGVL